MKGKAKVICENCVFGNIRVLAENGWSIFLETTQGNYLFDTGQGKTIINNAKYYNIDLSSIEGIIISHHHIDHTGGLLRVLNKTGNIKIYSHPDLFKNSYMFQNSNRVHIGIPFKREFLEKKGAKFIFNQSFYKITKNIFLSGEIPRNTDFEKGSKNQFIKSKKGYIQDPLLDDQALIIKTHEGLTIILGCTHAGIINTIDHIIKKTGEERINTIIGGTHLSMASNPIIKKTIKELSKYNIRKIGVSHCTGLEASMLLYRNFKKKFFFCNVGCEIYF